MNIYDRMEAFLRLEPRARERKYKDHGIRQLLLREHPVLADIPKETLIEALRSYNSYDRAWRKVLESEPALRGSDYEKKHELAMKKMDELGYAVQPHDYTKSV